MPVTVSPLGMERLLRANGFRSTRAGSPVWRGKDLIVALIIVLDDLEMAMRWRCEWFAAKLFLVRFNHAIK